MIFKTSPNYRTKEMAMGREILQFKSVMYMAVEL